MSLRVPVATLTAEYNESPAEARANTISHSIGLIFALAVAWPLMARAIPLGPIVTWTIGLFAAAQIFTYLSSSLYHGAKPGRWRRIFLACDHIAIYWLIAGTWTPLILLTMDHWFQAAVLIGIWGMAIAGTFLRMFRYTDVTGPVLLLYLFSGWAGIVLLPHIWYTVSPWLPVAVVTGGLLYTIGVGFYLWRALPFNHLYWHLFSLAGSVVHFTGIWLLLNWVEA